MYSSVLLFLNIGSSEMILIVFVALLLFGGEKLPEIAKGLGKGIRDFKDASEGVKREINNQINSYEEKNSDNKAIENAIKERQEQAQGTLPVHEGFTPVENTMPVSDNHYAATDQPAVESKPVEHVEPVAVEHATESHIDLTKSGEVKNT